MNMVIARPRSVHASIPVSSYGTDAIEILDRIDDIALIQLSLSDQIDATWGDDSDAAFDARKAMLARSNELKRKSAELHRHLRAIQADPACGDTLADFAADEAMAPAEFVRLRREMDARAEVEAELDEIASREIDEQYRLIEMFDSREAYEFGLAEESCYVFEA